MSKLHSATEGLTEKEQEEFKKGPPNVNKQLLIEVLAKLYKAKPQYPYAALAYILKPEDLLNFLDYFGGTTIEVPTKEEFTRLVQVCLIDAVGDFDKAKAANHEMLAGLSRKQYERISARINS